MKTGLLDTAEYWVLGLGIAVLPLGYRAKRPDGQALKQAGYKLNGAPEWQRLKRELPGEDVLRLWFSGPRRNIGIVTGWQGLVVLDFDDRVSYAAWLAWARHAGDPACTAAECTHRVFSARGVHVYVGVEESVTPFTVGNIDVKAAGGYVLAPPSIHPTGAHYLAWSDWSPVVTVARLSDAFPFSPPEAPAAPRSAPPHTEQATPWDWEPGVSPSFALVRERVSLLDMLPDARRTSGDGRWWLTHCPFHADNAPSLWIDTENGICGCLAGCTPKPLDAVGLYQRLHGCSASAAARELLRGAA